MADERFLVVYMVGEGDARQPSAVAVPENAKVVDALRAAQPSYDIESRKVTAEMRAPAGVWTAVDLQFPVRVLDTVRATQLRFVCTRHTAVPTPKRVKLNAFDVLMKKREYRSQPYEHVTREMEENESGKMVPKVVRTEDRRSWCVVANRLIEAMESSGVTGFATESAAAAVRQLLGDVGKVLVALDGLALPPCKLLTEYAGCNKARDHRRPDAVGRLDAKHLGEQTMALQNVLARVCACEAPFGGSAMRKDVDELLRVVADKKKKLDSEVERIQAYHGGNSAPRHPAVDWESRVVEGDGSAVWEEMEAALQGAPYYDAVNLTELPGAPAERRDRYNPHP
eukprot:TRINITY_DN7975_c0_g1_i19.p1 TRINITY_DN7975_c0_g1~~TRINITY_DN7975_c0_g1_i19.p1  ORF type:complete len:340 (-),score=87.87 TRINITY_DN7975_c0_g1_i19:74-1093(-)